MQIYFAAPLFCEAELAFNQRIAGRLEDAGHHVFLPQRDGLETTEIDALPEIDTKAEMMQTIFELDREEVENADLVTAVLDGRTVDEGVALEVGLAYAWGIPVIGLRTDRRSFGPDEPVNAMIWGACTDIVDTPEKLVEAVHQYA